MSVDPGGPEAGNESASLAEKPKDHQPKFTGIYDLTFDAMDWEICFLIGTGFAPKL
ncbi:uncharacterized protein SAMN05216328_13746 [Ensifer sp. YR511]|nr:uncharacterized protein SAMN05216328_13746 [Ensifer sp. YR511]